jgi:hypothetical protein
MEDAEDRERGVKYNNNLNQVSKSLYSGELIKETKNPV